MRRGLVILTVGLSVTALGSSCDETVTEVTSSTFSVQISASSPFLANGETLVGDQFQLSATVTENGNPVQASGRTFTSSNPGVVEILNASTGQAEAAAVGTTTVAVTFEEPAIEGSQPLGAEMKIKVESLDVDVALVSEISEDTIAPDDALVTDTLRAEVMVTRDGEVVQSSGVSIASSTNTDVVQIQDGKAVLGDTGSATLTVAIQEPDIPGDEPLSETLDVTVRTFSVEIAAASDIAGSDHLTSGDTLITDSVTFSATVMKAGGTVSTSGARWSTSDPSVVEIIDPATGRAFFAGTGQATATVEFDEPSLPADTVRGSTVVPVTTYAVDVDIASFVMGSDALANGDTLITDSVKVTAAATRASDGAARTTTISSVSSSAPAVASITPLDTAVFTGTGSTTLTVELSEPTLPSAGVEGTLSFQVWTFVSEISAPASAPTMGDTVQYGVIVTETKNNTTVSNPDVTFASSNTSVIRLLDASTGRALARDTSASGTRVRVTLNDPGLPAGAVADTADPVSITDARFYGSFTTEAGDFGDTVTVTSDEVHSFTNSTQVEFDDGNLGFIISQTPSELKFVVPAGLGSSQVTLQNLTDDDPADGTDRDDVLAAGLTFAGGGTVADAFEPNDFFEPTTPTPLPTEVKIGPGSTHTFPFERILSWDPSKSAPADSNFFYFVLGAGGQTLDITVDWQLDADIDFVVCSGNGDPPDDYVRSGPDPVCQREVVDNANDRSLEQEQGLSLSAGIFILGVYCVDCSTLPPNVPLTYRLAVE